MKVRFAAVLDDASLDGDLAALPAAERAGLGSAAVRKRRAERLAGRRAARAALTAFVGAETAGRLVIGRIEDGPSRGAPRVVDADGAERADLFVGISHAGAWAVAAAAHSPLGIDLVELNDDAVAAAPEAFLDEERAVWQGFLGRPGQLLVCASLFAVKEAVLKLRGVGLGAPLLALRTVPSPVDVPSPDGLAADARALAVAYSLGAARGTAVGHLVLGSAGVCCILSAPSAAIGCPLAS